VNCTRKPLTFCVFSSSRPLKRVDAAFLPGIVQLPSSIGAALAGGWGGALKAADATSKPGMDTSRISRRSAARDDTVYTFDVRGRARNASATAVVPDGFAGTLIVTARLQYEARTKWRRAVSDPISHTSGGDAPLSAARDPDPRSMGLEADESDELVGRSVTINRPRPELYAFWREVENLAQIMENIETVVSMDERRSHWTVRAPGGKTVEWDSVIVDDIANELISWKSEAGADVSHSGRIEFRDAPGGRGTLVTATIVYDPPAGAVGKLVAKLFQREPRIQARRDLRRFKQFMETGEIATSRMNADANADESGADTRAADSH
jgi:uncharacterized membrane protein